MQPIQKFPRRHVGFKTPHGIQKKPAPGINGFGFIDRRLAKIPDLRDRGKILSGLIKVTLPIA